MNSYNNIVISFIIPILFTLFACSSDDEPVPVNEEEVITTMTIILEPQTAGTNVTLQTRDLDGDGPNPPEATVSGALATNTSYNGFIELLNETQTPAEDVTGEVAAEGDEHQFFFQSGGGVEISTEYSDQDQNGDSIGLTFTLTSGESGSGVLTVVLRHLPDKNAAGVSDGDISNAGGETDVTASFPVEISR